MTYYRGLSAYNVEPTPHALQGVWGGHTGLALVRHLWDMQPIASARRGYTDAMATADGAVRCWWAADRPAQGVKLEIAGSWFDAMGSGARDVVARLVADGVDARRFDLKWDDTDGVLDMATVFEAWRSNEYKTMPGRRPPQSFEACGSHVGEAESWTVYLPHVSSRSGHVKVYNKQLEQLYRTGEDGGHCVRVELSARGDRAAQVVRWWLDGDIDHVTALLLRYADFVEPTDDANKRRWPRAEWWERFIVRIQPPKGGYKNTSEIDTTLPTDSRDETEAAYMSDRWLDSAAIPRVARAWAAHGFDNEWLQAAMAAGLARDMARHPEQYEDETIELVAAGKLTTQQMEAIA